MDLFDYLHTDEHKLVLETEEIIIPIATDRIWLATIVDEKTIVLMTVEKSLILNKYTERNICELLSAGLVQISSTNYINPNYIKEYKIANKVVELINGKTINVDDEYSKNLMGFFKMFK